MAQPKEKRVAESRSFDDGKHRMRERRLESINNRLHRLGLPPLRQLGDYHKHEFEITGIVSVHDFGGYYSVVVFSVIRPDGQEGTYSMVMNAKHVTVPGGREGSGEEVHLIGAVCLVTINERWLVVVRQYRPTLGRWMTEIPRGAVPPGGIPFGRLPRIRESGLVDADVTALGVSELPLGIVGQEISSVITAGAAEVTRLSFLGAVPENTGNSTNVTSVFWLNVRATNEERVIEEVKRRKSQALKTDLIPLEELEVRWPAYGLETLHCMSALLMLFRARRET